MSPNEQLSLCPSCSGLFVAPNARSQFCEWCRRKGRREVHANRIAEHVDVVLRTRAAEQSGIDPKRVRRWWNHGTLINRIMGFMKYNRDVWEIEYVVTQIALDEGDSFSVSNSLAWWKYDDAKEKAVAPNGQGAWWWMVWARDELAEHDELRESALYWLDLWYDATRPDNEDPELADKARTGLRTLYTTARGTYGTG